MTRSARALLGGVFVGAVLIVAGYLSAWMPDGAPRWGDGCMIAGCAVMMAGATGLGALRSGVHPAFAWFAASFLVVIVAGGFGAALLIPADPERLVMGLPLRAAIEIYGIAVLPVVVLPVLFAAVFPRRDR